MFILYSDRYKDVIESVEIAKQMQVQHKSVTVSLNELDEYLIKRKQMSIRGPKPRNATEQDNTPLSHGRLMSSLLDAPSMIYQYLEDQDYPKVKQVYKNSLDVLKSLQESSTPLLFKNSEALLMEVSSSLSRCRDFIEYCAAEELMDMYIHQDVHKVFHCLSTLLILDNSSSERVLQRLLTINDDAIESAISSKHDVSALLPKVFGIIYFLLRSVTEAFVLGGLRDTLLKDYQTSCEVDLNSVSNLCKNWLMNHIERLRSLLPNLLKKTSSLTEMLQSLSNVNALKMSKWNFYCSKTTGTTLDTWGDVLRDPCLDHFNQVIQKQIEAVFSDLKTSNIRDLDVNVASFVWNDSEADFELKKKALVPGLSYMVNSVSSRLSSLTQECELLMSQERLSFLFDQDILEMRSTLVGGIESRMKQFLEQVEQTVKKHPSKVLPLSLLIRSLFIDCPSLRAAFKLGVNQNQYDDLVKEMQSHSQKWLCLHYYQRIEIFSIQLLKISETSIEQMTEGSLNWQEISLTEDGTSSSFIRIPIFPSQQMTDFLTLLSHEVNTISGHGIGNQLCVEITVKMSKELLRVYRETLDRLSLSKLPESIKEKKAVQCYFDLLFLRNLIKVVNDERIKKETLPQLNEVVKSFESLLDPFDLHLMTPHLQSRVLNTIKTTLQMSSMFLPEYCLDTLKKISEPKETTVTRQDTCLTRPSNQQLELLPLDKTIVTKQ